jgi:glycerol-3-phosphate dehydrogenase (NAD+)
MCVSGELLSDILATATVEGVPTAEVAIDFAQRCNLDLPIFKAVAGILDGSLNVDQAQLFIMSRPLGNETPLL